jgi:hypothetical protein
MKFKTPKSKDVMQVGKGLLAFEGGKRVGRGVVGLIPAKDANQTKMVKGGLAVASVLAAAAYRGGSADIVIPALVGVAAEQIGDIIDQEAAKMITKNPNADMPQKFLQDAMGLGCPCDDMPHDQAPPNNTWGVEEIDPYPFPSLNSPTIKTIEWETVWDGNDNSFTNENAWGSGI